MARRRNYSNSYSRGYSRNKGLERALQHIREAEELSKELGGTDKDVKRYFFNLPPHELRQVLDEYGRKYGRSKQDYAEFAMSQWRSGQKKMSGLVAGRLYSLLPRRMPIDTKYSMVETLWKMYSPKSNKRYLVGPDASLQQVMTEVTGRLNAAVSAYQVPDPLSKRFQWLSDGDVNVYQQLLNHFLDLDRKRAIDTVQMRLPVIFKHLNPNGGFSQVFTETISVGGHQVVIEFSNRHTGVKIAPPGYTSYQPSSGGMGCVVAIWLFALALLSVVMALAG